MTEEDEKEICPMRSYVWRADEEPVVCVREKCAWWMGDEKACAVWVIAANRSGPYQERKP